MDIYTALQDNQMLASVLLTAVLFLIIFYFVRKSSTQKEIIHPFEQGEFPPSIKKTRKLIPKHSTYRVYTQKKLRPMKLGIIKTVRRMGTRGK